MANNYLTSNERHSLMFLLQMKLSYRSIGERLNKHHSTISREVARNSPSSGSYCDKVAQKAALTRSDTA
jgi:IS30 family transposase